MRAGRHSPVRLRRIRPQSRTVACRRKTTEPRRAPERRISSLPCHIARNHRIRLEERRTQCFPCHCRRNTNPHNPQTPLTSTPNQRSSFMPPDADWHNGATRRTMVPIRAALEYHGVLWQTREKRIAILYSFSNNFRAMNLSQVLRLFIVKVQSWKALILAL